MPDEPFALSTVPPALPAQGDYDAICATVMESARGRWFLQEYARRNRNADTRLVLDAIERIEAVIRGERGREAYQSFRGELLDMAKAIAQTRAEVAEFHPEAGRGQVAEPAPPAPDVFAAAERIQEVAWTMRERGLDPSTCDQIDALAASILAASALRDPNDQRAHKLGEVLQHLERRINAMLDSCAESTPAATQGDDAAAGHSPPAGHEHDAGIHAAASGIAEAAKSQSAGAPADQGTEHAAVEPEVATPPAETHVQALADAPPELADAKVEAETTTMPVGAGAEQQSAESAAPHGFETEPVDFVGPKRDLTPVPSAVDETAELAPPPLEPQASVPIAEAPAAEVATVAPALPTRITPLPTPPPQGGREQTELAACADSTSPEHAVMADLAEPLAVAGTAAEPQWEPADPQVEAVELELEPLAVVPAVQPAADAPAGELELAPIVVEAAFEPSVTDTPAFEAADASVQEHHLPVSDQMSEPALTAPAQPDSVPAATIEESPADMAELELAPLVATPVEQPVLDNAPPAQIELEPIAVELAPVPIAAQTTETVESPTEPSPELAAATPENATERATDPATAAVLPPDHDATGSTAAEPQPTAPEPASEVLGRGSETAEAALLPSPQTGSLEIVSDAPAVDRPESIAAELEPAATALAAPTDEQASGSDERSFMEPLPAVESAPELDVGGAAPSDLEGPVEAAGQASPDAPIAASAPAVMLPEEEAAQPPVAAPVHDLPEAPAEPSIERPAVAPAEEAPGIGTLSTPTAELEAELQGNENEPEPIISVEQFSVETEPLAIPPAMADVTVELPPEAPAATEAQAPPPAPELPGETDMLSAAWETAVSRPDAEPSASTPAPAPADLVPDEAASPAPEAQASPAPGATMPPPVPDAPPAETPSAELADFLLEPLPVTVGVATQPASAPEPAAQLTPVDTMTDIEEELFAAVPEAAPDQPPACEQPAAMLQPEAPQAAATLPQVTGAAVPIAAAMAIAAPAAPIRPATKPMPRPTPSDPLAALKAMSDEERIALFT